MIYFSRHRHHRRSESVASRRSASSDSENAALTEALGESAGIYLAAANTENNLCCRLFL